MGSVIQHANTDFQGIGVSWRALNLQAVQRPSSTRLLTNSVAVPIHLSGSDRVGPGEHQDPRSVETRWSAQITATRKSTIKGFDVAEKTYGFIGKCNRINPTSELRSLGNCGKLLRGAGFGFMHALRVICAYNSIRERA
jgi:hypothetical protein